MLNTVLAEMRNLSTQVQDLKVSVTGTLATHTSEISQIKTEKTQLFTMANKAVDEISLLKTNDSRQDGHQGGSEKIWKAAVTVAMLFIAYQTWQGSQDKPVDKKATKELTR